MVYPFYSRHKDFMPKGSLTVATNCRYCNKPYGMKAGAETHSAWMPREFSIYSCRIFVPSSFINDRSSFHFYYFVPPICETVPTVRQSDILHLSGATSRKMKNGHLAEGQARTEWHWLTASVTQQSLACCLPMPPLSLSCLSGCCAVSLPPISFIFASRLPFIIHGLPFL